MSKALFQHGGLRFWNQDEIQLRDMFKDRAISVVKRVLSGMNQAWRFEQVEGPILHPRSQISAAYSEDDIFVTNHVAGEESFVLRAETTPSSYAYARDLGGRLPLCVYQAGISSRREMNDGASASRLRFNSFWQLEFQCIYSVTTKADYRTALIEAISKEIRRFTMLPTRVVESDRLPSYSESTLDIEVEMPLATGGTRWTEMASCSIRNDFSEDTRVCEIAIGLDRIASLAGL